MASPPPKLQWAVFLGLACLALAIRLPRLADRPMHTDEAVNAYITGELLAGQAYRYDPQDRHGPALCAVTIPVAHIAGIHDPAGLTETQVRLVPAFAGALTVLLFGTLFGAIRFAPSVIAALMFAVAPLPVYYSRYFIHETLFVAATLGLVASGWWAFRNPSPGRGAVAGLCAGLMLASKETAAIHFAALGVVVIWWFWHSYRKGELSHPPAAGSRTAVTIGCGLLAFVVCVLALYSWFGRDWQNVARLFDSAPHLAARAAGEGHEKPPDYYVKLLGDNGAGYAVLALAAIGAIAILRRKPAASDDEQIFPKMLLLYGASIGLIYSAIPYKVPWLALNLWLPAVMLAGYGVAAGWRRVAQPASRVALLLAACVLVVFLGRETWQRVFVNPAEESNPYAYAQTGEDLLRLPDRVARLAQAKGAGGGFRVAVVAADAWPLPWYLRRFKEVGYWQPQQDPGIAHIYITPPEPTGPVRTRLENWRPEYFGVRPGVLLILWTPPEKEAGHE